MSAPRLRLAALQYPQPLDLAQVQQALDPGTVMLSYQIGADASRLFVVRRSTRGGGENLAVRAIAIGETELREQVAAFLRLVERDDGAAEIAPVFMSAARRLYDVLVAPAEREIAAADRVLILPDGPLHSLPFAALMRKSRGAGDGRAQYLVEWKPLHTTLSATVYAELRKSAPSSSGPRTFVAFGDPEYPRAA